MTGGAGKSTEAAPVVAASIDQSESSLLRELVGDEEALREVEMGDDSGSELTELESSLGGEMKEEEWEGKNRGRPNFRRAAPGAQRQQSTQEFFRRGNLNGHGNDDGDEDNIFATPGKTAMRGALARSLSLAVASNPQQVATAETLNPAEGSGEGFGRLDVGAGGWADEMANEVDMERMAGDEGSTTPTPTPARWASATPVPVTPTKGNKRMAVGTPKATRRRLPVRPMPVGFAAASALEQILAAIAGVEQKMEERITALAARMMEGMEALAMDGKSREGRITARLLEDAEKRERRLGARLLAMDGIETELAQKAQWEIKQWTDMAGLMERRRVEMGEVRKAVEGHAAQLAAAPARPVPVRARPTAGAPEAMEGVVATRQEEEEDKVEEWSDMEGVERDGLHRSAHAPGSGERAVPVTKAENEKEEKEEKGKASMVQVATPAGGKTHRQKGSAKQQKRQAAADASNEKERAEPKVAAPIRQILKRPETAEAEKNAAEERRKEEEKKDEEKAAVMKRWEEGDLSQEEWETYNAAARPIQYLADDAEAIEEVAAGQRMAHRAGMRALDSQWEKERAPPQLAPVKPRQQQQRAPLQTQQRQHQQHQQQQQRQQPMPRQGPQKGQQQWQQQGAPAQSQQQQGNWAQRAAAAAALPQTGADYSRAGRNGKPERTPTGLEPIKGSIPRDERGIVFERASGAPQINLAVAVSAAAHVNVALSKVAPPHVRTEAFRISVQGRLSTTARFGAPAAILLRFKKEILEAARKADRTIINVAANGTWAELKILVPYDRYRHQNGLEDLKEQIEAENPGVVIPPPSMKWMRLVSTIERQYQDGRLPRNAASVIFKVPGKVAAQKLLVEMWVAGNRFCTLPYIPDRADTLCSTCSQWGHSEFRCQQAAATCTICAGAHRTEEHRCEVAICGKVGKVCPHTEMKCPNCGGRHPAQDARCQAKRAAIEIARGRRANTHRPEVPT